MPTQTKSPSVTEQLHAREQKLSDARQAAHEAGRELRDAVTLVESLHDRRRQAAHRDPELVDGDDAAVDPENEVGLLDAELASVPDVDLLRRRYAHTQRLSEFAQQSLRDFAQAWSEELGLALQAEAKVKAASATIALENLRGEVRDLLQSLHHYEGLTHERVPALDPLARFLAALDAAGIPELAS